MNCQKIYNQIIEKAKLQGRKRSDEVYYESHHILPKCMGGDNSKDNLVLLSAREHFLCHWLLIRLHPENKSLAHSFWLMCNAKSRGQKRIVPSSRVYQEAKECHSRAVSGDKPWIGDSNKRRTGIKRPKVSCSFCSIEIGSNNIKKHETSCISNPNRIHTPNPKLSEVMGGNPNNPTRYKKENYAVVQNN